MITTQSSELQRVAEEAERNAARLDRWRRRWTHQHSTRYRKLRAAATRYLRRAVAWCPRSLATSWIDQQIEQRNLALLCWEPRGSEQYLALRDAHRADVNRANDWATGRAIGMSPAERALEDLAGYEAACDGPFASQAA